MLRTTTDFVVRVLVVLSMLSTTSSVSLVWAAPPQRSNSPDTFLITQPDDTGVTAEVMAQSLDTLFEDDFERANSSNLGSDWVEAAGDWAISSGRLHTELSDSAAMVFTTEVYTATRYVIETQIMGDNVGLVGSQDAFGLGFAADPVAQTGYQLLYSPWAGQWMLFRDTTLLATAGGTFTPGDEWVGLRVLRNGQSGTIEVYVDSGSGYPATPLLQTIDATYPELGVVGFGGLVTNGADVYVEDISVAVPSVPNYSNLPGIIYKDDFERADSSYLGFDWFEMAGDWEISSGRLHVADSDSEATVATTDVYTVTHYVFETHLIGSNIEAAETGDFIGLGLAGDPVAETYYSVVFSLSNEQWLLYRDDTLLAMAAGTFSSNVLYGLRVVRDGSSGAIEVYIDSGSGYPGTPLMQATDTTYPELGAFGFSGWTGGGEEVYIEDISVAIPPVADFSADPVEGDAPLAITLTNTSQGTDTYLWDFGDPAPGLGQAVTSTLTSPVFTYTHSGVYTVSLTANGPGGTNTLSRTNYITVTSSITAEEVAVDFYAQPLAGTVSLTVTFTGIQTGATSLLWDFGDNTTQTITDVVSLPLVVTTTHPYFEAGSYTVTLTAEGLGGTAIASKTNYIVVDNGAVDETISGLTVVNDSPTDWGQPTTLTATLTTGTNVSYTWDFGDGEGSDTGAVVTHTYPAMGEYTAVVTASNSVNSAAATTTVAITATPQLTLSKTAPLTATAGSLITYTLTISNAGPMTATGVVITDVLPGTAYYVLGGSKEGGVVHWDVGEVEPDSEMRVYLYVTATETLTNSDYYATAAGGMVITGTQSIVTRVGQPPVARFSAFPLTWAAPAPIYFLDSSTGDIDNYLWDFGDGIISTASSPTHTYTIADVYTVSLTVSGPFGSDTLSQPNYITVTQPVVADFWADPVTGTAPLTVTFTNSSTNASSYLWDFGDGNTSAQINPTHPYTRPGVYTVILTATNGSDSDTRPRTNYITVTGLPVLALAKTAPLTVTAGDLITYTLTVTNSGSGTATGLVITDAIPANTFYISGGDAVTNNVVIWAIPDLPANAANSVQFVVTATETITNNDYAVTGDGVSASGQQLVVTVVEPGLKADFGAIQINEEVPSLVQFLDYSTGDIDNYLWDFGDGVTSTITSSVVHTYSVPNVYTVSLTVSNSEGYSHTLKRPNYITVTPPLLADLSVGKTGPLTATAGTPITYTLIVTNSGNVTATNLVITDVIPTAAHYITGGTFISNVVSWTADSLASGSSVERHFVVTATETITNSDYAVVADDDVSATGQVTITTYITPTLPITGNWHMITTTNTPAIVGEHAMAYDSDRDVIVVYGGNATGWPYEHTTWELSGTTWLSTTTTGPAARYGAQMGYDGDQIVLFGGSDETDSAQDQTWSYNESAWTQLALTGTVPSSRTYHSMVTNPISDTLYLFGGNNETTYFNDLWAYQNGVWSEIDVTGEKPAERTLSALAYDSANQRLLLFGGRTITGTLLADLWTFDLTTEAWYLLDDGGGGGPSARMAHALIYDVTTGNIILVGGTSDTGDTLLDDIWHYAEGWTQVTDTPFSGQAYLQVVDTPAGIVLFSNGEVWRYE